MSIQAKGVYKVLGLQESKVLRGIDLDVEDGEFIALTGKSGSGKSTLLYVLSTLDHPSEGSISYDGKNASRLKEKEVRALRNEQIGFVFQFHYLLPELTAFENVLMPAFKKKVTVSHRERASQLLAMVGLEDRMHHLPRHLSGGQNQRVAIARALMMSPKYVFADEPTGSLDSENSARVFHLFQQINQELKTTIIMVTHDAELASAAGRVVTLKDGEIIFDSKTKT